jgi:hypothetical protein
MTGRLHRIGDLDSGNAVLDVETALACFGTSIFGLTIPITAFIVQRLSDNFVNSMTHFSAPLGLAVPLIDLQLVSLWLYSRSFNHYIFCQLRGLSL